VLLQERWQGQLQEFDGEILTRPTLTVFDTAGQLMPAADVRISSTIISAVPISDNSHDVLYAQPGTPVRVRKSPEGRLEITGLSKRGYGAVFQKNMTIYTGHIMSGTTINFTASQATLGELASATSGGFGETPLNAMLVRNAAGSVVALS